MYVMRFNIIYGSFTYDESIADKPEKLAPNSQADQEQYLDFMLDATFRKSIICKADAAKNLNYDVANPEKVNTVPVLYHCE